LKERKKEKTKKGRTIPFSSFIERLGMSEPLRLPRNAGMCLSGNPASRPPALRSWWNLSRSLSAATPTRRHFPPRTR
jgi:hypothetical protein